MVYSNEEKVEMLLIYGECGENLVRTLQLYAARYPEKTQPSRHMFARLIKNLRETGSINPRKRNRLKTRTDEAAEVAVLGAVANSTHLSTRQIESYSGISKTSVHRILKCRVSFFPTTYRHNRNCMGTVLIIANNFVRVSNLS
jgi:hypothetical protein